MVALEVNGAGQFFLAVEGAAGDARYFFIVDNGLAILDDSYPAAEQCDVELLPDTRTTRLLGSRRQETIDGTHVMTGRFGERIILHLDLVAAAQINAAVGV